MAPKHFIREWRKQRGFTLGMLALALKTSPAVVSRIETGVQRYNQEFLEAAAEALGVTEGDLIMRDPNVADLHSALDALPPDRRAIALEIIKTLAKEDPK